MENNNKRSTIDRERAKAVIIPLFIGMAFTLVVIFLATAFSQRRVLVKDIDGNFFRARSLFIAGPVFICSRGETDFDTRNDALKSAEERSGLYFMLMKNIQFIEVLSEPDESGQALPGWQPTLKDYIGDYVVNAAGNHGYLSLRAAGGAVYGSIRFPDWGRGVTEYLKYVRIVNGKLYFTRSVITPQELRRLGANAYFIQNYSGEYFRSGNLIRGHYIIDGARKPWEAQKTR